VTLPATAIPAPTKPLYRIHEAAAYLGVSDDTLSKWIGAGKVRKIEGTNFIAALELVRFQEEHSRPKTPEQRKRGPYKTRR
jgi:predicted site-specific integrase-resolvase